MVAQRLGLTQLTDLPIGYNKPSLDHQGERGEKAKRLSHLQLNGVLRVSSLPLSRGPSKGVYGGMNGNARRGGLRKLKLTTSTPSKKDI